MTNSIDIKAKAPFPGGVLSNFAAHAFTCDGIACAAMEGFLQSLKVEDVAEQEPFCALGDTGPMVCRCVQRSAM